MYNLRLGEVGRRDKSLTPCGEVVTWDGLNELDYWGTEWVYVIK